MRGHAARVGMVRSGGWAGSGTLGDGRSITLCSGAEEGGENGRNGEGSKVACVALEELIALVARLHRRLKVTSGEKLTHSEGVEENTVLRNEAAVLLQCRFVERGAIDSDFTSCSGVGVVIMGGEILVGPLDMAFCSSAKRASAPAGLRRPVRMCSRLVFPEPDGPC